jgi:hypothetical protein
MVGRRRHSVRIVASLLLVLAVGCWLTASAGAASHAYRADYQGSYTWHEDFKEAAGFAHTTETLTWNWLMYTEEGEHGKSTSSGKLTAQGTLEEEGSSTPPLHCTITQASPSPKFQLTPGVRPGTVSYNLAIPQIGGSEVVVSGNGQNCAVFTGESALLCTLQSCGTICATGSPPAVVALRFSPASQLAFNPSATEVASGPGHAYDLNGPASSAAGPCFRGTETSSLSIISSVTVGGGAPPAPRSPSKPKTLKELKVFAQGDLLTTLLRAEVPCGQLGAGALAGLWSLVVPGLAADAAIVPAVVIGAAAGPTCIALIDRANIDAEIIEDPPDPAIFSLARPSHIAKVTLPSCTTQPASVRSFCTRLRTDVLAYVSAVEHGSSDDAALLTTVDRLSTASRKGNSAAIAIQSAAGVKLEHSLQVATRAQNAAGARIAALVGSEHVQGELSAAQDEHGIETVVADLARRGIARSALPPAALVAKPTDILASMSGD